MNGFQLLTYEIKKMNGIEQKSLWDQKKEAALSERDLRLLIKKGQFIQPKAWRFWAIPKVVQGFPLSDRAKLVYQWASQSMWFDGWNRVVIPPGKLLNTPDDILKRCHVSIFGNEIRNGSITRYNAGRIGTYMEWKHFTRIIKELESKNYFHCNSNMYFEKYPKGHDLYRRISYTEDNPYHKNDDFTGMEKCGWFGYLKKGE
jgi:hypothetical protein